MSKTILIAILFFLLVMPGILAQKNSIKLLAVNEGSKEGIIVNLDIEVREGSGKIFIETYPLTHIDTQISLRLAKTIACKTTDVYCRNKDFLYSLRSLSPVIAGPSAGAAMTLVTLATLENKQLDPSVVITGTINSGGVVGAVGGVKEKIFAAANASVSTVLIPKGEENATQLIEYGTSLNVTVIEVSDIEEAYELFTHQQRPVHALQVDQHYRAIMHDLGKEICERTNTIQHKVEQYAVTNATRKLREQGLNLSQEAEELYKEEKYYSAASRCFGANVYLREALLTSQHLTEEQKQEAVAEVKKQLLLLSEFINGTRINNLGELETIMIMRERIIDAQKNLEEANDTLRELSYAIERTYSAFAWKQFIAFGGIAIDETKLQESCVLKIEEVQELYNYVAIYEPLLLQESKKGLDGAKEYLKSNDYVSCLFKASKAEAEVHAALGTLYIDDDNVESLLQNKILAAQKAIIKQTQKGAFPVLGYSYYEYATALQNKEGYSGLLYAEYGIELSNLDVYFPQKKPLPFSLNERALITLILGFIIGAALLSIRKHYRRNKITFRNKR